MDPGPSHPAPSTVRQGEPMSDTSLSGVHPAFRKFLVAVVPGEPNPKLWGIVAHLLGEGTRGIACHVVMQSTTAAADDADGSPTNPAELAIDVEIRTRMTEHLCSAAQAVPVRILHGDPGQRICEYAAHTHCDLIVLGRGARSSFKRFVRGSVSTYVLENSRGSILRVGD
jgi:nucleotide-binding universal stress UspA family protein